MSEDASLITRWSALDRLHRRIDATVERRLHQRLGLGVSEFRALTALDSGEAEARTLQLRDLATQVGLSQSATSRLVIRLRDRGLITTSTPAHDHRSDDIRPFRQAHLNWFWGSYTAVYLGVAAAAYDELRRVVQARRPTAFLLCVLVFSLRSLRSRFAF